mmetsp:Transcript_4766/g.11994  ORF Transcript_4766/g.11994 Transcript_4766/m.11994 type:complete len:211 (+) Transcript_4766:249-881(+)
MPQRRHALHRRRRGNLRSQRRPPRRRGGTPQAHRRQVRPLQNLQRRPLGTRRERRHGGHGRSRDPHPLRAQGRRIVRRVRRVPGRTPPRRRQGRIAPARHLRPQGILGQGHRRAVRGAYGGKVPRGSQRLRREVDGGSPRVQQFVLQGDAGEGVCRRDDCGGMSPEEARGERDDYAHFGSGAFGGSVQAVRGAVCQGSGGVLQGLRQRLG